MRRAYIIFVVACSIISNAQTSDSWADSILNKMTLSEKIGQLFMIPVSTYATAKDIEAYEQFIKTHKPGSLYITKGSAKSHIELINRFQQITKVPLLVGMNAEWGIAQTLDSTFQFPQPIILGANANSDLVKDLGYQIGLQMRAIGAHINFAPHADIDVPKESLVISRYIGSNKIKVADQSIAFVAGLRKAGVMAVAKHLPSMTSNTNPKNGNGIFTAIGPDTVSFYPFQKLIQHNIGGILTSNVHFSTLEKNRSVPGSLSQIFINDIIKKQYGFEGLTFADLPFLKTILNKKRGEVEKTAFQIGNDVLIAPEDISKAIKKISKLVSSDKILMTQLETSVKKILRTKFSTGLHQEKIIKPINIDQELFSIEAKRIDHQLKEGAITLLRNSSALVPLRLLDNRSFKLVTIDGQFPFLEKTIEQYVPIGKLQINSLSDTALVEKEMSNATVIIAVKAQAKMYGQWIQKIAAHGSVIVCHFGNPADIKYLQAAPVLLEGYDEASTGDTMAEAIFGGISTTGILPMAVGEIFPEGTHQFSGSLQRLSHSLPEEAQMDGRILSNIDSIVNEALAIGAAPGARVMVARKGKVVFDKSFGWQASDKKTPVTENTIYDLASITKVTATLQAVMFMHERGLIDINKKISVYLPEFKGTNKADIIIKDILTHQSGLWPYFPWHVDMVKDSSLMRQYFQEEYSSEYPFPVSKNLFSHKNMRDSMWHWIVNSKMIEKKDRTPYEYKYSDLGLYIMQRLVEQTVNQPLEDFVSQNFYEPMGAYTTGFHPLQKFPENQIAPTENDIVFRKSLLIGYVHDPGAAMYGGVAGHAGLFSNANDLMKMGQLWLQKGSYGGTQYFKPETIELFTTKQFETSRRGLGWDKPTGDWTGSTGVYCSPLTFGHTGFTGTCIWVDPQFDLVYVFLSNRVNPEVSGKLLSANIRTRIQDVIYEAIFSWTSSH